MQVTVNHPPNLPGVLETVLSQVKYWKLAVIRPSVEISPDHVAIMGYYADVTIVLSNR